MKSIYFRSKQALIIPIIILLAATSVGIFYFYRNKLNDTNSSVNTIEEGDLSISSALALALGGGEKVQGGDTVTFNFKIENKGSGEAKFVTLKTDIEKSLIFDIRNIQGATGIDNHEDVLVFRNLTVQPNQSINVSFDASLVFSDQERELRLQPKLFDIQDKFVAQGSPQRYAISKNESIDMPSNVKTGSN